METTKRICGNCCNLKMSPITSDGEKIGEQKTCPHKPGEGISLSETCNKHEFKEDDVH